MTKIFLFTLFLITLSFAADCDLGKVLVNNSCIPVTFIEGCASYKIDRQCDLCEYGYEKDLNGFCIYNDKININQCCLQQDQNGFCIKCAQGLYLEKFNCKRNIIDGCVAK